MIIISGQLFTPDIDFVKIKNLREQNFEDKANNIELANE